MSGVFFMSKIFTSAQYFPSNPKLRQFRSCSFAKLHLSCGFDSYALLRYKTFRQRVVRHASPKNQ